MTLNTNSNSCNDHHHLAHRHHPHYHHVAGQIGEGEVGPLLTVSATDQDCSPSLGKVNLRMIINVITTWMVIHIVLPIFRDEF